MIEIRKQIVVTVSMDVRTLDQIRDAIVIAIEKGPAESTRYINLLAEIDAAYVEGE